MLTNAFVYKNRNEPVELKEIEISGELGPNEIEVDTAYAALNPVDIKLKAFALWNAQWRALNDFSGTVTKVGSNVRRFQPGDVVSGQRAVHPGNCAVIGSKTRINIAKNGVMLKPKSMTPAEAAASSLTFGTAFAMATSTTINADSSVLVLGGATSVGQFLVQLLKRHYKVKRVVATCSPSSAAEVKALGADETVSYREADYIQQLKAAGPFFNVYDCAGGRDVIDAINDVMEPASKGSTYVTVSGDAGLNNTYSSTAVPILKAIPRMAFRMLFGRLYGINYKLTGVGPKEWPEIGPQIIDDNKITVKIASEFAAKDIEQAFQALDKAGGGKVVVKF